MMDGPAHHNVAGRQRYGAAAAALALAAAAILAPALTAQPLPAVRAALHVGGLESPVAFVQDPVDRAIFYVVEQRGRIRIIRGRSLDQDFLDLRAVVSSGGERGLLGLAFAPDFATSGRFYVDFTNANGDTVIARFRRGAGGVADPVSRFDLRLGPGGAAAIPQPFANHNGGHLAFGPDGYLYIGMGDGGSGDDPQHNAQNPGSLLGKMLRVDVNVPDAHAAGYVVPPDNPFTGSAGARPEIWSFGLRNPWRFSFDAPALGGTGALIVADVGQNNWEEIDYEPRGRGGRNYGWRNREGAHANVLGLPPAFTPLVDPVFEYNHAQGQSITGGYVYRGRSLGERFRGRYFFADFVAGRVWSIALAPDANGAVASDLVEHTSDLGGTAALGTISSFGVDADGELFVVCYGRGTVLRLLAPPQTPGTLGIRR